MSFNLSVSQHVAPLGRAVKGPTNGKSNIFGEHHFATFQGARQEASFKLEGFKLSKLPGSSAPLPQRRGNGKSLALSDRAHRPATRRRCAPRVSMAAATPRQNGARNESSA